VPLHENDVLVLDEASQLATTDLAMILEACQTYADLGCVAVSVTGPYYYKVSQESIEHFFRELAKRSPIPAPTCRGSLPTR